MDLSAGFLVPKNREKFSHSLVGPRPGAVRHHTGGGVEAAAAGGVSAGKEGESALAVGSPSVRRQRQRREETINTEGQP